MRRALRQRRARKICKESYLALALIAISSFATSAQATEPVQIDVDASAPGAAIERIWPFYGFDEVNYATTPEGVSLLTTLAQINSTDVYVRNHFLLNSGDGTPAMKWGSTNVYSEDSLGNAAYDFTLTDGIFDAIASAGALPLVEIGFMPRALSTHPDPYRNSDTTSVDGGCFYPPSDYAKWGALIRTWAAHANARYSDVASRWLWELWNEPDVGYWHGSFDEYAKLYDFTEAALHDVLPSAVLGGPAVASPQRPFLRQFLEHCATGTNGVTGNVGTRLDLISFHAKGGVFLNGDHVQMDLGNQLRLHRLGFDTVAAFPEFRQKPIYITEADPDACAACPLSSNPGNAYRMSSAYGAYELAMMRHSLDIAAETGVKLNAILTWAFTFPGTPYFAGYRVLATNGIHLPVLGAFRLLGSLVGARLPLTSSATLPVDQIIAQGVHGEPEVDGMATLDGETLRVLLWSYHDELTPAPATPVELSLQLPPQFGPNVRVEQLRVDEAHGDAHNLWLQQGSPAQPNAEQLNALERGMSPSLLRASVLPVSADGTVSIQLELPRFAVSLLTVRVANASTSDGHAGCACVHASREAARADWVALFASALFFGAGSGRLFQRRLARRPGSSS